MSSVALVARQATQRVDPAVHTDDINCVAWNQADDNMVATASRCPAGYCTTRTYNWSLLGMNVAYYNSTVCVLLV